jgi:hypothetical protein
MARSQVRPSIKCPATSRQVAFHQLLVSARRTWLAAALTEALADAEPALLKAQILECGPSAALKILAAAGIRDEMVFPTPLILERKPTLLGYYRLLAGIPQKSFYASGTGMSRFKSMEAFGNITENQKRDLPELCRTMGIALADLVTELSPTIHPQDVAELPLLTLGAQFQGANNNRIGQQATRDVFMVIASIAERAIESRSEAELILKDSAGNKVTISLASDPDVQVQVQQGRLIINKLAIEIKGGTDRSNAHNRAGEAEKSHQKARKKGFPECWTLIFKKGLSIDTLRQESPSTNHWFDVAQVLAREGDDWAEFRTRLANTLGIPLKGTRRTGQG